MSQSSSQDSAPAIRPLSSAAPGAWPRMIALVDMNAFFASIEQLDNPHWRGRPVAVTNGTQGTCIITCSYEARAYGVKTGMRLRDARELCPEIIQCPGRPKRYADMSRAIMASLINITPVVEVFSVDEAFLDLTAVQHLNHGAEDIGQKIKQQVFNASGLYCSVGLSGDKTTAKYAAKVIKPDGLTIIPPWQAAERLRRVPVTELCGIGNSLGKFLAIHGVRTCGDMQRLPVSVLAKRFGNPGRRIWLMAQGKDPATVDTTIAPPKSVGHGKVMPPNTRHPDVIRTYLHHMSYKVAARLRRHQLSAQHFFIGLNTRDGWIGGKYHTAGPIDDAGALMQLCYRMLQEHWRGQSVHQVQVTALDPKTTHGQQDLFLPGNERREALNHVMDEINQRFGDYMLAPAPLLHRSSMPNVIAPAWKPEGHRQSV